MQSNRACRRRLYRGIVLLLFAVCATLSATSAAGAYEFGSGVGQAGPEQMLFDWTTDRCEDLDIPDLPARAFRGASGRVQLITTHYTSRRYVGSDLNQVKHSCNILLNSTYDANPAAYNDKQWIASPYTLDGRTVYALVHHEFQGWTHSGLCDPNLTGLAVNKCLYYGVAFARSTDGGATYTRRPVPADLVATSPYPYSQVENNGPAGLHLPSNIVFRPDGYYYSMVVADQFGAQAGGACLMRTHTLSDPTSWRAWDGSGFSVRFIDPYAEPSEPPEAHVCTPVSPGQIGLMSNSLTYNTYFGKYLLVGVNVTTDSSGARVSGVFYSLSSDLIHWTKAQLLMQAELPWQYTCGAPDPIVDPSLLYPGSPNRNFDITTQDAYLYFTRFHIQWNGSVCYQNLDRDLIRIPIRFTGPRGPVSMPDCTQVRPSVRLINYSDNRWVPVTLSDPSHKLIIEIDKVFQDEATDGIPGARYGTRPDQVRLRAARDPDGNGRVYRIWFHATGGNGTCWNYYNSMEVGVTRSGKAIYDEGKVYDSLNPSGG